MSHLVPIPVGLIISGHPCDGAYDTANDTMVLINGVLHATDEDYYVSNFWIPDISIFNRIQRIFNDNGFTDLRFTPFSSPDRWSIQYPEMPIEAD